SYSPSPFRGGGWGEGFFGAPRTPLTPDPSPRWERGARVPAPPLRFGEGFFAWGRVLLLRSGSLARGRAHPGGGRAGSGSGHPRGRALLPPPAGQIHPRQGGVHVVLLDQRIVGEIRIFGAVQGHKRRSLGGLVRPLLLGARFQLAHLPVKRSLEDRRA